MVFHLSHLASDVRHDYSDILGSDRTAPLSFTKVSDSKPFIN